MIDLQMGYKYGAENAIFVFSELVYAWRPSALKERQMKYVKVVQSGNSQATRLPEKFSVSTDRAEIFRRGDEIIQGERPASARAIFDALTELPSDFMADGRADSKPQARENWAQSPKVQ